MNRRRDTPHREFVDYLPDPDPESNQSVGVFANQISVQTLGTMVS